MRNNRAGCLAVLVLLSSVVSAGTLKPYRGEPLPAFTLADLRGVPHPLADLRGHVVLVNFWATWCPPCIREMPSMQRLTERLHGKPFALLAVNMGEDPETISAFLQRIAVDFTVLVDRDGTVVRDWGVFAYPSSFLLDGSGRVTHVLYGESEWDSPETVAVIESLLP